MLVLVQVPAPGNTFLPATDLSRDREHWTHEKKGLSGDLHVYIFQVPRIFIQV